jgi:hypothetical protein
MPRGRGCEFVQKPVRASFLLDAIDRSLAERCEFTTGTVPIGRTAMLWFSLRRSTRRNR